MSSMALYFNKRNNADLLSLDVTKEQNRKKVDLLNISAVFFTLNKKKINTRFLRQINRILRCSREKNCVFRLF